MRSGGGPFFLEFETYRHREHCGHNFDNELGYRTLEEFEFWKERDPIKICESSMLNVGQITKDQLDKLYKEIKAEVDEAFSYAEASPFPQKEEAFQDLFSSLKE